MRPDYIPYRGESLEDFQKNLTYKTKDFKREITEDKKVLKEDIAPYFPSKELVAAVEYARILNRPLLLRGEPGCGKTRLAQAVAYELYKDSKEDYQNHYFEWHIKSTTKSTEGLYSFNHVKRLRDIQMDKYDNDDIKYCSFGPLGKAFFSSKENQQSVLLIDEIDKADIDFPNDLLLELDQKRFYIEETGEEIIADHSPIIIITSNDEKELPNAFLRRCVFHYIEFPSHDILLRIVKAKAKEYLTDFKGLKLPDLKPLPDEAINDIVTQFEEIYKLMESNPLADKIPSTSELLDWLKVIHLKYILGELSLKGERLPDEKLLYPGTLLKSLDDQKYIIDKWNDR